MCHPNLPRIMAEKAHRQNGIHSWHCLRELWFMAYRDALERPGQPPGGTGRSPSCRAPVLRAVPHTSAPRGGKSRIGSIVYHYESFLSFRIRSLMSDCRVIIQRSLCQPRPWIDKGLTGRSPHLSLLAQGGTPMNIHFHRISWICPITEVVSLLSDVRGKGVDLPW